MERRDLLSGLAVMVVTTSGCTWGSQRSVDLQISNRTDAEQTVHVTVGGTVIPEGESPEGVTKTSVGSDEVYFDRSIELGANESRAIGGIMQTTDYPITTGVGVDVLEGPQKREPVEIGPVGENRQISVIIELSEISISVTE